jgi:4a-hydroxytetrahydrobiopterin dehydratase
MTALVKRRCKPCDGKVAAYSARQARAELKALATDWRLIEGGKAIKREFSFRDFYRTMSFVNALAHVANIEDHHPDLEVGYNYCRVRFSTHAIGGLSENDFICAAKTDRIPLK